MGNNFHPGAVWSRLAGWFRGGSGRIRSARELAAAVPGPVAGTIPHAAPGSALLVSDADDAGAFAEAFRGIVGEVLLNRRDARALLVTSAGPGEGKSTVAANCAVALARGGSTVLLVDCDLRRGALADRFKLEVADGMTTVLKRGAAWEPLCRTTFCSGLTLLPRGPADNESERLLTPDRLAPLLRDFRARFQFVILDSPPVPAAPDAALLAPWLDGFLFVVRANQTNVQMVRAAMKTMRRARATCLGLVLNRTATGC